MKETNKKIKCLVAMVAMESNHKSKLMVTQGNFDFQVKVINDEFHFKHNSGKKMRNTSEKSCFYFCFIVNLFKMDFFCFCFYFYSTNKIIFHDVSLFLLFCKILLQKKEINKKQQQRSKNVVLFSYKFYRFDH